METQATQVNHVENLLKHFGMFYQTEESQDFLMDTMEEVIRILNGGSIE